MCEFDIFGKNDYGYFGNGLSGYAHYTQTYDSIFNKSEEATVCTEDELTDETDDEFDEDDGLDEDGGEEEW